MTGVGRDTRDGGAACTHAGLACLARRARVAVVARGAVRRDRVRTRPARRVAGARRVALVRGGARHRRTTDARAGLARVGLRAGVAVVAGRAVGPSGSSTPRRRVARARGVALVGRRCTSPGSTRCRSRSGTCRSACRRCRRCTRVPFGAVGFEHAPSPDCTCRPRGTGRAPCTSPGSTPVQVPALAGVGLRARVAVVARRAVRRRRVRARPVAGLHVPAAWHWSGAVHVDRVRARCRSRSGRCRSACRRCRRCTRCRSVRPGWSRRPSPGCTSPRRGTGRPRTHVTGFAAGARCRSGRCPSACRRCRRCTPCRSAAAGFEQTPVAGLQSRRPWHWSAAAHVTGFDPVHTPAWQVSVCVQALPSLQAVPLARSGSSTPGGRVARPGRVALVGRRAGRRGSAPVQTPAWHVSVWVQALPSLHAVPLLAAGFEQAPVDGSHVLAPWHAPAAAHVRRCTPSRTRATEAVLTGDRRAGVHQHLRRREGAGEVRRVDGHERSSSRGRAPESWRRS